LTADRNQARSCQPPWTPAERRARRFVVGCLGAGLLGGGACTNTTLTVDFSERDAGFNPDPGFDPDLGLLAHWALDESEPGSAAMDSSGFGHHGTPSANPPVPTPDVPPVGFQDPFSLSFNGQDQWIEMGNPTLLNIGGPTSMAAWIRATSIDGFHNVVAHGYRSDSEYDFALRINYGNYQFTTWDGAADHAALAAIPASDLGTWVHLCGAFDGTTYYLYRNGMLAASTADATMPPVNIDAIWAIGARAPHSTTPVYRVMEGQIDDVRIYGRALSSAEVDALYHR
jgi:hypothetical protein